MAEKVWEIVVRRFKDEKGIQKAIMEGVGIALILLGFILFCLLLVTVKRSFCL